MFEQNRILKCQSPNKNHSQNISFYSDLSKVNKTGFVPNILGLVKSINILITIIHICFIGGNLRKIAQFGSHYPLAKSYFKKRNGVMGYV